MKLLKELLEQERILRQAASKAPKFKAGKALKDVVNTPAAPAKKSKKK